MPLFNKTFTDLFNFDFKVKKFVHFYLVKVLNNGGVDENGAPLPNPLKEFFFPPDLTHPTNN